MTLASKATLSLHMMSDGKAILVPEKYNLTEHPSQGQEYIYDGYRT